MREPWLPGSEIKCVGVGPKFEKFPLREGMWVGQIGKL